MGLFDFVKDIGHKLFSSDADAAEKITAHILANNPGIENLGIIYKDGQATVIGTTRSAEAAQKAVLMAGNIKGVSEVVAKIDIVDDGGTGVDATAALEPQNVEYYLIQSGDSLSKIAKKYYGNGNDYPKIFEANREVIKDPDLIFPGQKIRIPLP
ncbi:peptidoglycan-binding protein LysM [Methylomonas methanica]|uniref:Peptidoglycan-binding lysin domain protein n=1 Tax=Methylomonas methanica (strain DSM 25384 / MC09) TaxID=857087 RepID=F9ZYY1_METMM|nr:peptidoglycan-binding protein LysM [Methylomonas methanica]AEF99836.1 Peptidoglycan-binding lysin domain protein [Methylomonas methanica MC09]